MVFDVSLEMQSDSKNYVSDDEITELVRSAAFCNNDAFCNKLRIL